MYLQLLILAALLFIFYQDMLYRAVYWLCFPLIAVLCVLQKQQATGLFNCLTDAGYNLTFIGIQLILLWVYFVFKTGKAVNVFKDYLGLGDVLFLIVIAFYLSPFNYILFYIGSLILILIFTILQQTFFGKRHPQIPLAGLQAFLLSAIVVLSFIYPNLNCYDDFFGF